MADIQPVQYPGHSWKKPRPHMGPISYEFHHTHDLPDLQITTIESIPDNPNLINFQDQNGQGVTLLYLSFFKPDMTFKCMNEILLLTDLH